MNEPIEIIVWPYVPLVGILSQMLLNILFIFVEFEAIFLWEEIQSF